jgi:hypothetical protein
VPAQDEASAFGLIPSITIRASAVSPRGQGDDGGNIAPAFNSPHDVIKHHAYGLLSAAIGCLGMKAAAQGAALPSIPLCPGLTIVTAISQQDGDYESIKTIESVGPKEVRLKYSSETSGAGMFDSGDTLKKTLLHRTALTADLESANSYVQRFLEGRARNRRVELVRQS